MKLVALVSNDPSDIYFANQLARRLDLAGVIVEQAGVAGDAKRRLKKIVGLLFRPGLIPRTVGSRLLAQRLRRQAHEENWAGFGQDGFRLALPATCRLGRVIGKGSINSAEVRSMLTAWSPDLIVVCGTSILREQVLSIPPTGVLNLHGGLSQRYRGIWTTHWALVNEEPEYVGATVHFVSRGIDDGDIVYQGRPALDGQENPESLYAKVVNLGVEMMIKAVGDVAAGTVKRYPLETMGRLYRGSMVTPEVLLKAWENTERGVIKAYLSDRESRDSLVLPLLRGRFPTSEKNS